MTDPVDSSLVIDSLARDLSVSSNAMCLAYVYCDYRDEKKQTAVNMISALVKQIISAKPDRIPDKILDDLKLMGKRKTNLELNEAFGIFEPTAKVFEKSYLCIDALDECNEKERSGFFGA